MQLFAAIGTCVAAAATTATAYVTYRMVSEIKKQRLAACRPELALLQLKLTLLSNKNTLGYRSGDFTEFSPEEREHNEKDLQALLCCHNVGLGAARHVALKWDFDYKAACTAVNKSLLNSVSYSDDQGVGSVVFHFLGVDCPVHSDMEETEYIPPLSVSRDPTYFQVPHLYLCLLCAYMSYNTLDHIRLTPDVGAFTPLYCHLSYEDIEGCSHLLQYKICIKLITIAFGWEERRILIILSPNISK